MDWAKYPPQLHLEKTHLCLERSVLIQNFVVGSVVGSDFILLKLYINDV